MMIITDSEISCFKQENIVLLNKYLKAFSKIQPNFLRLYFTISLNLNPVLIKIQKPSDLFKFFVFL